MSLWDDPVANPKRRPSLKGAVMLDVTHGAPRVRIWPRSRGKSGTPRQKETREWFRQAAWAMKYITPDIQSQVAAARVGKPLLPRDLLMMMLSSRLGQFHMPNGTILRPAVAINDVSEMLDFISSVPGTTLYRGPVQWEAMPFPTDGNEWWFSPPDPTSWMALSGDADPLTFAYDAVKGLSVDGGPLTAGNVLRARVMPILAPSQPWTLDFRMDSMIDPANYRGQGVFIRNQAEGKILTLANRNSVPFDVNYWADLNTFAFSPATREFPAWAKTDFWRIQFDGTTLRWSAGPDGVNYALVWSGLWNAYFTQFPDQIGFGGWQAATTGPRNIFNVRQWGFTN